MREFGVMLRVRNDVDEGIWSDVERVCNYYLESVFVRFGFFLRSMTLGLFSWDMLV